MSQLAEYLVPINKNSEADLITRAQAGDTQALGELYALHHRPLMGNALRLADPNDAEDLVQETFVRAMGGLGRFKDQGRGLKPWLGTIMHNLAMDMHKSRKCRPEELEFRDEIFTGSYDITHEVLGELVVTQALELVDEPYRELLSTIYIEDQSKKDYAVEQGITTEALKSRLWRARGALRRAEALEPTLLTADEYSLADENS